MIRQKLNECLLDNLIPTLLSQPNTNQKYKFGLDARLVKINDIVFDREAFIESGNIQGCLGKVEAISKSKKWIVISKVRTSFINKLTTKNQNKTDKFPNHTLVARRISDCYFVTHSSKFEGRQMMALGFQQKILSIDEVYNTVKDNELPLYTFNTPPQHLIDKSINIINNPKIKIRVDNSTPNIKDMSVLTEKIQKT